MLKPQTAATTGTTTSYISLVASLLDQQNAQFNNAKESNFRSLKECDKEVCNYDDNDLVLLKRCRQN